MCRSELHFYVYDGQPNVYTYVNGNPVSLIDPLGLFNYAKGAVAAANVAQAGYKIGAGAALVVGGVAAGFTGAGLPVGAGAIAWGLWQINSGVSAARRGKQQMEEAKQECSADWRWQNFLGVLPFGQHLDDPHEQLGDSAAQHYLNLPRSRQIIFLLTGGF